MTMTYTIGLDYGSNSMRAILVRLTDGEEVAEAVYSYPSGDQGILLDPNDPHLARQHPKDYLEGLKLTIQSVVKQGKEVGIDARQIIGIGVDSTGSTPLPVDASNQALALKPEWENDLAALAWLWKDHTGVKEAQKITEVAETHRPHYLARCGGTYSSEWFWAKILKCLNVAPKVFEAAYSWVELADYIPAVLTGCTDPKEIKRGVCAAGHKAMYAHSPDDDWHGLPDQAFLAMLAPELAELRHRLYEKAFDADTAAGTLSPAWSKTLGLSEDTVVAVGAFDAHYGAIGSGIREGTLVKIIGTSTCDCAVKAKTGDAKTDTKTMTIPGICGAVDGSILPGFIGLEAGQSAVGDIFKWFVERVCQGEETLHSELTEKAHELKPGQSGLLALDWNNGNRTILVDPELSGLLIGQTLYTSQAEIYRSLIEATAFGARMIIERINAFGGGIDRIICCGGITLKNDMLMQIYADVIGCDILISSSSQTCALGSAMVAAVCAGEANGGHASFDIATEKMTAVHEKQFKPNPEAQATYNQLFALYQSLHDSFGGVNTGIDLSRIMKELLTIKKQVTTSVQEQELIHA